MYTEVRVIFSVDVTPLFPGVPTQVLPQQSLSRGDKYEEDTTVELLNGETPLQALTD